MRSLCLFGLLALVGVWSLSGGERETVASSAVLGSLSDVVSGTYARPEENRRKPKVQLASHKKTKQQPACGKSGKACPAKQSKRSKYNFQDGYRTLCVRLCDGFYYPVRSAAQEGDFALDEEICRSSCSSPTKLFVYRNRDGAPETMTDLEGKPYVDLATAFQFRVSYNPACTCTPSPWTVEAHNRHRLYELESTKAKADAAAEDERRVLAEVVERETRAARQRTGADLVTRTAAAWKVAANSAKTARQETRTVRKATATTRAPVVRAAARERDRRVRVVRTSSASRKAQRAAAYRAQATSYRGRGLFTETRHAVRVYR